MMGKHSEQGLKIKQLEETIALKDQEIKDIKFSVADILLQIRTINESNNYSDPSIKRRKISELCTDTRYELLIDEIDKADLEFPNDLLWELDKMEFYINETKENNMKYKTAQDLVSREYIFIKKENVSWQTESY